MMSREANFQRVSDKHHSLLWAAVVAFARHGFRGTSLRDVAAEAGTSLTLISHHFGSKNELVNSAIVSLSSRLQKHVSQLGLALETHRELCTAALIDAWLAYVHSAFGDDVGLVYLRLMLRLQDDDALDDSKRAMLDLSRPVIRRSLRRLYPDATAASLDALLIASGAAIYSTLAHAQEADGGSTWEAHRPVLRNFLIRGIDASVTTRPAQWQPAA